MTRHRPLYTARAGAVTVPVTRFADGRFCVTWRACAGTPRQRETFHLKVKAIARADELAAALAEGRGRTLAMSEADRAAYADAVAMLAKHGVPLRAAVEEYCAARTLIAPHTLTEAATFFRNGNLQHVTPPPTAEIIAAMLAELADDRRSARHTGPLATDLARFAAVFPVLTDATEEAVRAYLRDLRTLKASKAADGTTTPAGSPLSPRRRDNVRNAIVQLMRFARKRGWLPRGEDTAAERIPKQATGGEVSTLTPAQLQSVLAYFAERDPAWLPWAAVAALAGLRTSEILRLDWRAFHWDEQTIAVPGSVARKIRVSRRVPILPALAAWLAPWRTASGAVIAGAWPSRRASHAHSAAIHRMTAALRWPVWPTNVLRHSFGSHRLAVVKSIEQVAMEMGNSPAKVREHYNDPKPESVAAAYFTVKPARTLNLIPFAATAS